MPQYLSSSAPHRSQGVFHPLPARQSTMQGERGAFDVSLPLRYAGQREITLRYELVGARHAPLAIVVGGISADRHVIASDAFPEAGWWQVQDGKGLDLRRMRILSLDWVGANGKLDAPIDPADQADAIQALLRCLGVDAVSVFIGCSYGAMVGLQFAARHRHSLHKLLAISGAHRVHPFSSAWRALQRQAVLLGQLQCDEAQGLLLARQLALLSYRTPEEFAQRFPTHAQVIHGRVRVPAQDYLEQRASHWLPQRSALGFQRLSESIDLQHVDPRRILAPTTVVGVAEDRLVPIEDLQALYGALARGELRILRSCKGHDAFLTEVESIAELLLESIPCGSAVKEGQA